MRKYTKEIYSALQDCYDHFNIELFEEKLPDCLITLPRSKGAYGYFWKQGFDPVDEIGLNPEEFQRGLKEVLSTLVHEMAHLWQWHYGNPAKGRFHNKEWAAKMLEIGLEPISLDRPGEMIGNKVTHKIISQGPYDNAFGMLNVNIELLNAVAPIKNQQKTTRKSKYNCPICQTKVWGKEHLIIICGVCQKEMEQV